MDSHTGCRLQICFTPTAGSQQPLVLEPAERHRVLVVVCVCEVVNVGVPPHYRSGHSTEEPVRQDAAVESPEHHRETPVETQHPVQVESEHFEPVVGAFDEGAVSSLATLAVCVWVSRTGPWWIPPRRCLLGCRQSFHSSFHASSVHNQEKQLPTFITTEVVGLL